MSDDEALVAQARIAELADVPASGRTAWLANVYDQVLRPSFPANELLPFETLLKQAEQVPAMLRIGTVNDEEGQVDGAIVGQWFGASGVLLIAYPCHPAAAARPRSGDPADRNRRGPVGADVDGPAGRGRGRRSCIVYWGTRPRPGRPSAALPSPRRAAVADDLHPARGESGQRSCARHVAHRRPTAIARDQVGNSDRASQGDRGLPHRILLLGGGARLRRRRISILDRGGGATARRGSGAVAGLSPSRRQALLRQIASRRSRSVRTW